MRPYRTKRIAAFTMIDIIVTLIISMLVMGISFSIFHLIYQQFYTYKYVSDDLKQTYQLYAVMQEDIQKASLITYDLSNELEILLQTRETYKYQMFDDKIIRKTSLSSDTFLLEIVHVITRFEGEQVFTGLIDEINFKTKKGDKELPFIFVKEYSAEMSMELE